MDSEVGAAVAPADGAKIGTASEEIERILRSARACDSHQILGVPADAPTKTVVKRYLKLSLKLHPDKQRTAATKEAAATRFTEVRAAYDVLSDPDARILYDMHGFDSAKDKASKQRERTFWSIFKAAPALFADSYYEGEEKKYIKTRDPLYLERELEPKALFNAAARP